MGFLYFYIMIKDLIIKNRSYRRFYEEENISTKDLKALVDLARLSPSGSNLQPLKFILSNTKKTNEIIFKNLAWAGYLKDWHRPIEGERPSAYIIILGDKEAVKSFDYDVGIVCQSMLLGAVEKGYGGCIFGSIKRIPLSAELNIAEHLKIQLIIALGKPKEVIQIDAVKNGDIKYWRDKNEVHHLPKRDLDDLIIEL